MGIAHLLGGKPILDPAVELANLQLQGLPVPPEFYKCNSLLNPLGRPCARGWLLMTRRNAEAIGVDSLHDLTLETDRHAVTVKSLVITKEPKCILPGKEAEDPLSPMLLEVADARWRVHNPHFCVPASKQYNVRAGAYQAAGGATAYLVDSLNGGSAWTWQTMVSDLWTLMAAQLGAAATYATLPFTPDGTPEGWVFPGVSAWGALCDVLDRLCCAVAWDHETGLYSIVRVGADDAAAEARLAQLDGRRLGDSEFLSVTRGKVPHSVRVYFHRRDTFAGSEQTGTRATSDAWQTSAVYSVDVAGGYAGSESGTYAVVWDDLPALYDGSGALSNGAALSTRAAERAADYYRALRTGGARLHHTYSGPVDGLAPGSLVKGIAFRQQFDNATAWVTEVVRSPVPVAPDEYGGWVECCGSTATRPPAFGPTWPVDVQLSEVIEIANGTISSGRYDATVEKSDGVGGFADKQSVWGLDLGGATELTAGYRYLARLIGFVSSRPLYAFQSGAGTIGGPVTFTAPVTIDVDGNDEVALTIKSPPAPTVNQFVIVDDSDNPLTGINKGGYLFTYKDSAPADGDIAAGQGFWWWNDALGAWAWKGKDSGGNVVSGTAAVMKDFYYWRQTGTSPERWYYGGIVSCVAPGFGTTAVLTAGTYYAMPFSAPRGGTLDRIAIKVETAASTAGKKARLGIYESTSDTNLYPDALVVDAGEVAIDSTGIKTATINQALTANSLYWLVVLADEAVTLASLTVDSTLWPVLGGDNAFAGVHGVGWYKADTYSALDATFPASGSILDYSQSPLPAIGVRFSA